MCLNPFELPSGQWARCRKCWQCRQQRKDDWQGRCVAETSACPDAVFVTLTYRDPPEGEDRGFLTAFNIKHVQKYLRSWRRAGYRLRYLVVGEMSSTKGRCHWHLLIWWISGRPAFEAGDVLQGPHYSRQVMKGGTPYPLGLMFEEKHWPWGCSFWEDISPGAIRYCIKYILKQEDDPKAATKFTMSKKPLIGAAWIEAQAGRYVDQGLVPADASYQFSDVRRRMLPGQQRTGSFGTGNAGKVRTHSPHHGAGRMIPFKLSRHALDLFLNSYTKQWAERRGGHPPPSEFYEEWLDRQTVVTVGPDWRPDTVRKREQSRPWVDPPGGGEVRFSEPHNNWFCEVDGKRLWWSYDAFGARAWAENIVVASEAARRRAEAPDRNGPDVYRLAKNDTTETELWRKSTGDRDRAEAFEASIRRHGR